jgi:head-tail adaptor
VPFRPQPGTRTAAGHRDKWVTIEQAPVVPAGGVYPVEAWTTLAHCWMSQADYRSDEKFDTKSDMAFAETQWEMPYRADMDPDLVDVTASRRLVYGRKTYDIRGATLLDLRRGIALVTVVKA